VEDGLNLKGRGISNYLNGGLTLINIILLEGSKTQMLPRDYTIPHFMVSMDSIIFGIPLGENAGGLAGNLQTGDGEFNQIFRIDAGIPLGGNDAFSAYGNVYGGYNLRNQGFSDEIRYGAELGIGIFSQKLYVTGRYDVIKSRNNEKSGAIDGSFFANNSEVTSLTGEISYQITSKVGVSATYGTALDGKIIYAAPSYSFGVFLKV